VFGEKWASEGGLLPSNHFWLLKTALAPYNFQSNEPFLKFLRQCFLQKPYMSIGHNLQPLPWGLWGSILLKNKIYIWKSTPLSKIAIEKFWLDVFGEMVGMERVLVANNFRLLKRAQATPISNRMSLYDNFFDAKCPGLRPRKKNTLCQRRSLLRQRYCAA
jgi:hypothetical protein